MKNGIYEKIVDHITENQENFTGWPIAMFRIKKMPWMWYRMLFVRRWIIMRR